MTSHSNGSADAEHPGTVYLIHFERPYKHARHYIGWASDLEGRLEHHRKGSGAVLMAVVTKAGIAWSVVQTWTGDRNFERRLKNRKSSPRFCPACREERCQR